MSLLPLQKISPRKASEDARQYAYRVLRYFILNLHLPPGRKMNEIEFADALGISRTPVNDTFNKLSRKNLVDIIPQKGAFVSKIDTRRIEQTLWIHGQLGSSMIKNIFIRNVKRPQFDILYLILEEMEDHLSHGDLTQSARLITDYYKHLYELGGKMDYIWESVQIAGMDLQRFLYLSTEEIGTTRNYMLDLTSLTDAMAQRDTDLACTIYHHHLSRIFLLLPALMEVNPHYFTDQRNKESDEIPDNII
ncbi:GntR family transcriptional regulator [Lacrimispora algidixylanolytica]|uniref:GntR family transcriptional regulator n=1 Tax=Lacrimispora algidixylanolytica TaxID=94868 RepID=A0A419TCC5_9FIRM|nr:GntR family transcriptional regulator [Lacrimispora algidixylanolytica]RKD35131.1 GntR family transcriptional regulator [Lacrimispora algidixylanolytica]